MTAKVFDRTNIIGFIDDEPIYSLYGGDRGYNDAARVVATADGVGLDSLWLETNQALDAWNAERSAIASLLSYGTTNIADAVPQSLDGSSFEEASEYGEPTGIRAPNYLQLGYNFRDYDAATRFTWLFLRDSTAEQVRQVTDYALAADNKLVNGLILKRLFDPAPATTPSGHTAYGLWTGADGIKPPTWVGNEFAANHSHYVVSGASAVDSADIEDAIKHVREHGYGTSPTSRIILLCNPAESELISSFRAGLPSRDTGPVAKHSFIPSLGSPAFVTPDNIVGQQVEGEYGGIQVSGSYGPALVTESYYCPSGYIAVFATQGPNNTGNVIGVRSHLNPAYQGLRIIPGTDQRYPLTEAFFTHSLGCGVRHRGSAVVTQIKANGSYDVPSIPV